MCLLAAAVAACEADDGTSVNTPGPAALVRFINAVPDTGTVDLRFVDRVENLPTLQGVAFRGASGLFQRAEAGQRQARVFVNSTDPALTQIRLVDTTLTLNANARYTLVYAGRAAGNQDRLAVLDDPEPPTPPASQIAIKILHAAVGTGNVDVYIAPATATANNADPIANQVAVVRNVPFLGQSVYVNVPVRPTTGESLYQFAVTAAGSTTVLFSGRPNVPGAPAAVSTTGPQPGVQIAGSVLTAVVAPGSIPGTRQSTTATQTPTVMLIIDKALNP
jgi:hypothetical protein